MKTLSDLERFVDIINDVEKLDAEHHSKFTEEPEKKTKALSLSPAAIGVRSKE